MAIHAWSVLCNSAIIDRDTNQLHIHAVVENITAAADLGNDESEKRRILSGENPIVLVSYWVRDEEDRPEQTKFRIRIRTASGDEFISPPHNLDLENSARLRAIQKLRTIPFDGAGRMWFFVDQQVGTEDDDTEWSTVARVPLDVEMAPSQERV